LAIIGLAGTVTLFGLYLAMRSDIPSVISLKNLQWQTPMKIYSADGLLMEQYGEKKRIPLPLDQMPQQLLNAILATEDDRFYLHFGVDPIGMGRAILGQIMGQNKGGASTISMQVARNFFGSTEQTYSRKLREIFTTFHIEYLLSKDEILALYMNKIPLGHRAFGFGAAAQVYYNKDVKELTLAQIAVLAGLPKAPSTLNPISRPSRALARRAVVLKRMFVSGYITSEELEQANNAPITAKKHGAEIQLSAPYVAEMAHQKMITRFGRENAYTGGYRVFTTVTSNLQLAAQQSVIDNILSYDKRHGYRGVISSLRIESEATDTETALKIEPITELESEQVFRETPSYHSLQPAIITQVFDTSVSIELKDKTSAIIEWQGMSWARSYTNDVKQGPAPKSARDILKYGDVVYVIEQRGEFILSQLPDVSSALISLSPDNGAIQASVGGFSFKQSQFNRVTQAKRQVGSNIKPFLYSAALDHGFTLASLVNDVPINQWDKSTGTVWRPKNSPPTYSGEIRVKLALAQSKNVIAVRLLREIGLDNVIPHLASFGFSQDDLPRNETLALGSASLTPLEIVSGFATFANGGFLIEPYIVERIEDSFGNIVYQADPAIACDDCSNYLSKIQSLKISENSDTTLDISADLDDILRNSANAQSTTNPLEKQVNKAERVISAQNAFLITEALNTAIWGADWTNKPYWQGTGYRGQTLNRRDIAGKTGTTNSAKDAWFSGFSRRLVTTSWIGFDDPSRELGRTASNRNLGKNQVFGGEAGARSAQPAWVSFMKTALVDLPFEPFIQPADIVSVRIDKTTGKLTHKTDKSTDFEFFMLGTAPTEYVSQDNSDEILDGVSSDGDGEIF